jgi:hypothetical protein
MTSRAFVARGLEGTTNARSAQNAAYYETTAHLYGTNYTVEKSVETSPSALGLDCYRPTGAWGICTDGADHIGSAREN